MRGVILCLLFSSVVLAGGGKQKDFTPFCGPSDTSTFWLEPALCEAAFGKEAVDRAKVRGQLVFEHNMGRKTLFIYDEANDVFFVKMNFKSDTMAMPTKIEEVAASESKPRPKPAEIPVQAESSLKQLVWDPVAKRLVEVP